MTTTAAAPEKVRRNYAYRVYPTRWQAGELDRQLRLCCDIYNAALEQRRRMWRDHHQPIGYREQSRQLTEARRDLPRLASMNALAQHEVLRRLDRAFDGIDAITQPFSPASKRIVSCSTSGGTRPRYRRAPGAASRGRL